jgi:hypothetical protein
MEHGDGPNSTKPSKRIEARPCIVAVAAVFNDNRGAEPCVQQLGEEINALELSLNHAVVSAWLSRTGTVLTIKSASRASSRSGLID